LKNRALRVRGPLIAFVVTAVMAVMGYALTPWAYAAGGYPGPDALPGVPSYGGYLGTIPAGGHSKLSWICGLDAPNATNHSPKYAIASIGGHVAAFLPITTQYGCAQFIVYVSLYNGHHQIAPCGHVYVSVNGDTAWILVPVGHDDLLITGVKHYHHVGAIFPFVVPTPPSKSDYCPKGGSTTPPKKTKPSSSNTTLPPPATTMPGYHTTSSMYNAASTDPPPDSFGQSPTTTLKKVSEVVTIVAVVASAGAAAASAGGYVLQIPESLVEEYASEIAPGGGLPFDDFPAGGAGLLSEVYVGNLPVGDFIGVPPGGGYPFGSSIPDGTVSYAYLGQFMLARDEREVTTFVVTADTDVPAGGGVAGGGLAPRTGGQESAHAPTDSGAGH
jgi:hypothetical protein